MKFSLARLDIYKKCTGGYTFRLMGSMALIFALISVANLPGANTADSGAFSSKQPAPAAKVLDRDERAALLGVQNMKPKEDNWHPPHVVKTWLTTHKGRTFRVTQLPNCEHMETLISYNPSGETVKRAKERHGGIAALSGSYHHPRTMALADFLQRKGSVLSGAKTGRCLVAYTSNGKLDISRDYSQFRGKPDVCAVALGQRLVPLERDGFTTAFMNRVTDRMAIGVNNNFIFIVQGKSDIWRLAHFMQHKLPVNSAVNSDGGHVVRGKAPVHLVFRWKQPGSEPTMVAKTKQEIR